MQIPASYASSQWGYLWWTFAATLVLLIFLFLSALYWNNVGKQVREINNALAKDAKEAKKLGIEKTYVSSGIATFMFWASLVLFFVVLAHIITTCVQLSRTKDYLPPPMPAMTGVPCVQTTTEVYGSDVLADAYNRGMLDVRRGAAVVAESNVPYSPGMQAYFQGAEAAKKAAVPAAPAIEIAGARIINPAAQNLFQQASNVANAAAPFVVPPVPRGF